MDHVLSCLGPGSHLWWITYCLAWAQVLTSGGSRTVLLGPRFSPLVDHVLSCLGPGSHLWWITYCLAWAQVLTSGGSRTVLLGPRFSPLVDHVLSCLGPGSHLWWITYCLAWAQVLTSGGSRTVLLGPRFSPLVDHVLSCLGPGSHLWWITYCLAWAQVLTSGGSTSFGSLSWSIYSCIKCSWGHSVRNWPLDLHNPHIGALSWCSCLNLILFPLMNNTVGIGLLVFLKFSDLTPLNMSVSLY